MSKICKTCDREVDDKTNYCPYCKGRSFRPKYEITAPKNDLVHRMFYWSYDNGAALSKSKLAGVAVFICLLIFWLSTGNGILITVFLSAVFGLAAYLFGLILHKVLPQPNANKLKHNDYGLFQDLKHLLFYWQDKSGGYIPSKTKILSHAVFLLTFGIGFFTLKTPVAMGALIVALAVEAPVFLIGYAVHKLIFKDSPDHVIPEKKEKPKKIKKEKTVKKIEQKKIIPEYMEYQLQLDELNSKFKFRDKSTRDLIAKRFEPPQLTYTRFISGVDKSKEMFERNWNSAATMINLADDYSPRISAEIESKIETLKAITKKLDDLSNELLLNEDLSNQGDVDNLIYDMDHLIDSVKDYDK